MADIVQLACIVAAAARGGSIGLFRESTKLQTVGTVVRVADLEALRMELQVQTVDAVRGGRPAEPVVADVRQCAQPPIIACVAEARGGFRLFREATQLKTVGTGCRVAGVEPHCAEVQIQAPVVVVRIARRG